MGTQVGRSIGGAFCRENCWRWVISVLDLGERNGFCVSYGFEAVLLKSRLSVSDGIGMRAICRFYWLQLKTNGFK